jgi:copper chaperone CopZ
MNTPNTGSKTTWIAGLITAIAASLCCITPVLALLSGTSSIASAFSWMEPYRPYLISVTVAVLGFAWYQKLKPKKTDVQCDCETEKPSFWQSKAFLGIVTALAIMLMTFPSYSRIFFPAPQAKQVIVVDQGNIQQVKLNIKGMDCEACSQTIDLALSKVPGVLEYHTHFEDGSSIVKFDKTKTDEKTIVKAVNETGYKIANTTPVN